MLTGDGGSGIFWDPNCTKACFLNAGKRGFKFMTLIIKKGKVFPSTKAQDVDQMMRRPLIQLKLCANGKGTRLVNSNLSHAAYQQGRKPNLRPKRKRGQVFPLTGFIYPGSFKTPGSVDNWFRKAKINL